MATRYLSSCIFCKIIKGEIPSLKLLETEYSYSFLDIGPLSKGHSLVIPKYHGEKLTDVPDEYLADILSTAKKIVSAIGPGATDYNILQNNGRPAHQLVDHVHFHIIPKPADDSTQGLGISWPTQTVDKEELAKVHREILSRL